MSYHFTTTLSGDFDAAIEKVTAALQEKGFGVMTTINVQGALKEKIGADINPYFILGACNPHFAYKALQQENKIGTMLPCNVLLQQLDNGDIEVSAVDPMASMQAIENPGLAGIATEVQALLKEMIEQL
ncbi:MAG: DUF302 domain-containing protein [Rhodospirillaceae bacterium]|mgnify:CR=1 FL=1|jgi:uncharacterized protein (DUF302 family)|nr:DUF302 domain-containing protein [Rhodospirillaceae bacterium]